MEGVRALLRQAEEAGLTVGVDGNELVIRGPRRAGWIARRLLARKAVVIEALRGRPPGLDTLQTRARRLRGQDGTVGETPLPGHRAHAHAPSACPWCRGFAWWRSIHGVVVCGNCHPPAIPKLVLGWLEPHEN